MNSLLQTLYHIPHFRRCVFDMKIGVEDPEFDPSKSIPLAMQRLFWQLQFSGDAVSTKKLTKSFGWGSDEAFVQHDVQELLRVLIDNLDEKMKVGTFFFSFPLDLHFFRSCVFEYLCVLCMCLCVKAVCLNILCLNAAGCTCAA